MAERSLRFDLIARDKSFSRTLDQAGRKGQRLNRQFTRVLSDAGDRGGTLFGARLNKRLGGGFSASAAIARKSAGLIAGAFAVAGVVQFAKDSVTAAATFDKTMRQVATVAKLPTSAIKDLRAVALDMGAKTSFSASQASEAMLELAKGGLTAAQIKAGGLKSTLTLAAAGGLELGEAANFVIKSLGQFGLRVDKAGDAAAALAGGANASTASVQDLGEALGQVGPGARNAGLSLQETVAVLAAFSDNGIRGSDAGTSLKTMLVNLVPTTSKAANTMRKLGLDFVDAHGAILPITEIAQQLKDRLGKLSQAQRIAALQTIFGSDATRAATVLMQEGAGGLARYIKATNDRGAAEKLAKENTKGAAGAFERLKGAIETVQIIIGDAFLPTLADAADWAAKKLPAALATLQEKLRIIHGWWKDNADIIATLGDALNTIFVPAADSAKTGTDDLRTSAQKLQDSLDSMLEATLRVTQGFIMVARLAGNVSLRVLDLIVVAGKAINVIDRLSGGSGHAGDEMIAWARDMRDQTRVQLGKLEQDAKDTQRAIDKLHGKNIDITGSLKLSFSPSFTQKDWVNVRLAAGRMATGGPVGGQGPRGKDNQLRWLAPDEHVWTGQEVIAVGGHRAMERWRQAVLRGDVPEMAGGGPVGQIDQQTRAVNKVQAWGTGRRMDAGLTKLLSMFPANIPHTAGSWKLAVDYLRRIGMAFQIISTFRPSARTRASGSVSYHALNRAVDLAGPNMLAIFEALTRTNPTELIYSGANRYKSRRGWSPIGRLDPITLQDHWSHVHAAYDHGGWLPPGTTVATNRTGKPERVTPADQPLLDARSARMIGRAVADELVKAGLGAVNLDSRRVEQILAGARLSNARR